MSTTVYITTSNLHQLLSVNQLCIWSFDNGCARSSLPSCSSARFNLVFLLLSFALTASARRPQLNELFLLPVPRYQHWTHSYYPAWPTAYPLPFVTTTIKLSFAFIGFSVNNYFSHNVFLLGHSLSALPDVYISKQLGQWHCNY